MTNHHEKDCCANVQPASAGSKHAAAKQGPAASGAAMAYICPMHPDIVSEHPGMCSECGMALVPAKHGSGKTAHDPSTPLGAGKHAGHDTNAMLRKFWIALALTVPIVAYSDLPQTFFDWSAPEFTGSGVLSLILGSVVFFWCGSMFLSSAWRELRARLPGMMTLIALATATAYLWSVYSALSGVGKPLWWELSTLIAVMLLGHWIEMKAVQGAKGALRELAKLLPDEAEVLREGIPVRVPLAELAVGDIILVRPGAKVPADGSIIEGSSELNESILTGESKPVEKGIGSETIAGSINGDGSLKVKVSKIGENTFLSGIMRLVAEAEASKSRLQMLSDRAALHLTAVAIVSGAVTLAAWLFAGAGTAFAIERVVAVLVIACPHALGLAIPLVASISTTMAARGGLLIRRRLSLEAARTVDVVLFDKTGTLTKGNFAVARVIAAGKSEEETLALAAAINGHSEHPIAKSILSKARERGITTPAVTDFKRVAGKGAEAIVHGKRAFIGNAALAAEQGIVIRGEYGKAVDEHSMMGHTVVHVFVGETLVGGIALADEIREESREAIAALRAMGVKVAMITGDSEDVAAAVSKELGVDEVFARVLPGDKAGKVKALQERGLKVAMVGDGVNDAPALTQADVGIAIGAGTNVAIESAGIILVRSDPRDIPRIIKLSKLTYSKMVQNLFWATFYNLAALPIAAGALYSWGIILQPAVAAVFMSLSTVIVSINAVLLRRNTL